MKKTLTLVSSIIGICCLLLLTGFIVKNVSVGLFYDATGEKTELIQISDSSYQLKSTGEMIPMQRSSEATYFLRIPRLPSKIGSTKSVKVTQVNSFQKQITEPLSVVEGIGLYISMMAVIITFIVLSFRSLKGFTNKYIIYS